MDLATLFGIVGAFLIIGVAMSLSGGLGIYIDSASRAANRRVEIVIRQDITTELQAQLSQLKAKDPELYQDVDSQSLRRFNIRPNEVF